MKKLSILAIAMGMLAFTACSEKKAPAQPAQQAEQTVITDSAAQKAIAGDYKSADGKRVITLNSDFTAKTSNLDKEFYKWSFLVKPEGTSVQIELARKGLDADVTEQAAIDTEDGSLLLKNETFRKDKK